MEWAPHSPNLNLPHFGGYLKDQAYENNPQTIRDLKMAIAARIRAIPKEEGVHVIDTRHLQVCLHCQGGHLEHILERT